MPRLHSQLPNLRFYKQIHHLTGKNISPHRPNSPPNGNACAFQLPSQQMLHRLPWNGFWLVDPIIHQGQTPMVSLALIDYKVVAVEFFHQETKSEKCRKTSPRPPFVGRSSRAMKPKPPAWWVAKYHAHCWSLTLLLSTIDRLFLCFLVQILNASDKNSAMSNNVHISLHP